jgi:ABC-2 type transport system permease protein
VSASSAVEPTGLVDATRRPGVRTTFGVELAKLTDQIIVRVLFAVCLLAPLGFALVMRIQGAVPADTLFGRWAKTSGFATSLTVLGFAGSLGLPFVAGVLSGDVFAGEDRNGTWKTILTRSCSRGEIFVGKVAAAAICAVGAVTLLALGSLVGGIALVGSDPVLGLSGQLVPGSRATWLVLASWAFTLLPTLVFTALGLLLSVVTRSGIVGVLGPAVVGLLVQLLSLAGPGEIVRALLPATPFDAWHGLFTEPMHGEPLLQGAVTSVAYIVLFLAVAWRVFRHRAVAGAETGPERRWRAPIRIAVAAAAIAVLLAVVGGRGPTAVTSHRLDASVSATFERLVSVQYRWRRHQNPPSNVGVRVGTSCHRAGGKRNGPGDDWACAVQILSPSVSNAFVNLDVTVRANGCYSAQAPPAIVGPLLMQDVSGHTFTNPLFAFDGCFGTA